MVENTFYPYLLILPISTDRELVDAAIEERKLGYDKIGSNCYLGHIDGSPESAYQHLKSTFGVKGEARWILLAQPVITK